MQISVQPPGRAWCNPALLAGGENHPSRAITNLRPSRIRSAPGGTRSSSSSGLGDAGVGPAGRCSRGRLPEGGAAVWCLLGLDEPRYGLDQRQVGEGLREVAKVLARAGVDFLRVKL